MSANSFLVRVDQINQHFAQMVRLKLGKQSQLFLRVDIKSYGATLDARNGLKYKIHVKTFPTQSTVLMEVTYPTGISRTLFEKQFMTFGTFTTLDTLIDQVVSLVIQESKKPYKPLIG